MIIRMLCKFYADFIIAIKKLPQPND